jgi:hypothetical protein
MGTRKMVGYDFSDPLAPDTMSKSMSVYSVMIPDTYGLEADELARVLNQLRDENRSAAFKRSPVTSHSAGVSASGVRSSQGYPRGD